MSLAEQKEKLHQFIDAADETTTVNLLGVMEQWSREAPLFSEEDFAEFKRRSEEHKANPESAIPWDESMARIRRKLQR